MKLESRGMTENLGGWLVTAKARRIRTESLSNGDTLYWYVVDGVVFIIQEYAKNNGWEVFVCPSKDNRIDNTLKALERVIAS